VNEFEERLGFPAVDPHGRPIPPRRRAPRVS
jgi:Mn-dependent DtxR family transcriptional regulator